MPDAKTRYDRFRALHARDRAFVMPNAWDAGSAMILTQLGYEAIATTSAGYAFSVGKRDSFAALSRDEVLANAAAIAAATNLPVSADLEDGFGAAPETVSDTVSMAAALGLVGGAIEDATGEPDAPIYAFGLAVDRIRAAAEAARGRSFLLTARAENYLYGRPDLKDTIARLQTFAEAGADVLYAPGLPDLEAIRTVCAAVDRPVNVVMGLSGPNHTVADLERAGVRRISTGGSFARAALGALIRAGREVLEAGTFTYAAEAVPDAEVAAMMSEERGGNRT